MSKFLNSEQQALLADLPEDDILRSFFKILEKTPVVKKGPAKRTPFAAPATPRVVLADPIPVKILQEYVTFHCAGCGGQHRFLMKNLVGYKSGSGIAFREVSEMTDKIKALLEDGAIESEERHVQVLSCSVCGGL